MLRYQPRRMFTIQTAENLNKNLERKFVYVFLTVNHSIDLFHLPTLIHNFFIH